MPRGRPSNTAKISRMEEDIQELRTALTDERAKNERFTELTGMAAGTTLIPVKNFSNRNVGLSFQYQGQEREVLLYPRGPRSVANIPLDYWNQLQDNQLVIEGYIARIDREITNPNIIENIDNFIRDLPSEKIKQRVNGIVNTDTLFRILMHIEAKERDQGDISSKEEALLAAIRDRYYELTGTRIAETDESVGI